MPKYIDKKFQKELSEKDLAMYKSILQQRRDLLANKKPKGKAKITTPWRDWYCSWPSRWQMKNIADPDLKRRWISFQDKYEEFNEKVKAIEMKAFENKEKRIAKIGNIVFYTDSWSKISRNFIIESKKDRDTYTLLQLGSESSYRAINVKWKDLVKYYDLSEISK